MKTTEILTLKKYFANGNKLKFAEYLLRALRLKKEIVEDILADDNKEELIEYTKDAIDEYKQAQQGFIFIATCVNNPNAFKLSKTKNSPATRIKQINNDLSQINKLCLVKYWPVFDRGFYEKLIAQKLEGSCVNNDYIEGDYKKIVAKIDAILESDYKLLLPLNVITPITPSLAKRGGSVAY